MIKPTRETFRTCIGCKRRAPVGELVRVARLASGELVIGRTLPGRGAWLCNGSKRCLDNAARHGAFARALRASVVRAEADCLRAHLGWMDVSDGRSAIADDRAS